MRPPSHSALGHIAKARDAGDKLQKEPVHQDKKSRNRNQENKHQRQDARVRVKNQVRAHHSGDRATRTQSGQRRIQG